MRNSVQARTVRVNGNKWIDAHNSSTKWPNAGYKHQFGIARSMKKLAATAKNWTILPKWIGKRNIKLSIWTKPQKPKKIVKVRVAILFAMGIQNTAKLEWMQKLCLCVWKEPMTKDTRASLTAIKMTSWRFVGQRKMKEVRAVLKTNDYHKMKKWCFPFKGAFSKEND